MANKEAVLLSDPTAQLNIWLNPDSRHGFWVKGNGFETKVTYSERRAWELAATEVAKVVAK